MRQRQRDRGTAPLRWLNAPGLSQNSSKRGMSAIKQMSCGIHRHHFICRACFLVSTSMALVVRPERGRTTFGSPRPHWARALTYRPGAGLTREERKAQAKADQKAGQMRPAGAAGDMK